MKKIILNDIFLFLDESGELGSTDKKTFLITILEMKTSEYLKLKKIRTKIKRKFKNELKRNNEIKFYKHSKKFIKLTLNELNKLEFSAYSIVMNKENYQNKKLIKDKKINDIYIDIILQLLEKINLEDAFILILDKSLPKKYITKLDKKIFNNLTISKKSKVFHENSFKELGLQFVDLIAGSCFQFIENQKPEFINIIKDKHYIFYYNLYNEK